MGGRVYAVTGALTAGIGQTAVLNSGGFGQYVAKPLVHGLVQGGASGGRRGLWKRLLGRSGRCFRKRSDRPKSGGNGATGLLLRTAASAVSGGTAAELGGGKFANGAISGAFVHLFNAELHRDQKEIVPYGDQQAYKLTNIEEIAKAGHGYFGPQTCAALLQTIFDPGQASTWTAGVTLTPENARSDIGFFLATFDLSGNYPNMKTGNHVAVVHSVYLDSENKVAGVVFWHQTPTRGPHLSEPKLFNYSGPGRWPANASSEFRDNNPMYGNPNTYSVILTPRSAK